MKKQWLKPTVFALLLSSMVVLARSAAASGSGVISLSTLGSPYTQDFNTLANSGLATDISNSLSINGWYQTETGGSATRDNELYASDDGGSTTGDTYSYGVDANTDRALGGLQSGTLIPVIGASFTNNTGTTVTALAVAYTGEQWRLGTISRTDQIDFQLSTDATDLTTGTWTDYNSLDFITPNTATAGQKDGNLAANRTAISFTITGLSIANGSSFWIRWNDFNASGADDGLSVDDFSITPNVVDAAPFVSSTSPLDNATNVAANTNITITFSEAVNVTGTIAVVGGSSGAQNLTPTGGPTTFTLDPSDFTAGETVTVTVLATQVSDQDVSDPPDNMVADYVFDFTILVPPSICGDPATLISAVQGNGASSPIDGNTVTIEAVVVGDFQDVTAEPPNELNGFFLQEEDDDVDADPNTSEGIFVFDGSNPATAAVAVGDIVRVSGTVDEFGDVADGTVTEIVGPLTVQVCSTGNTLPTPATVDLPVSALSDYEKIENMSVTFVDELTVTEVFTLGRFGEVLLSEGGRLPIPTHVAEPGAPAQAVRDLNNRRSIMLDDGLTNQNPDPLLYPAPGGLSATNTLRGGDTTTSLSAVLTYFDTTEDYRLHPTGTITWNHDNPRPADTPVITGTLTVVGSNTLNFFTTLTTAGNICGPLNNMECRGANSATEFTRQRDKLLNALAEMNADIVGLNELENNSSASPAGNGDDVVLESIVDGLNAMLGAGTYDFIDTGVIGGDAIKVGFIYKPATVTPIGDFEILDSSVDPTFIDTRNRPALAQTFEQIATGEMLTVSINHLKSKGSACNPDDPDTGDLQGNCNLTRTAAATALANWLATDPTGSGDPDFLIMGDLNSYSNEDPIDALLAAGYTDLADYFHGSDAYSYVFDGEWGYLDYGLANETLLPQVTAANEWHINADEPIVLDYNTEFKSAGQIASFYDPAAFRVSDHDPMMVGLTMDTVAPDTTIDTFPPDPSNSADAEFTYSSSEGGNQFECQLDGGGWVDCDDGQSNSFGLSDDEHTFEVRAIDAAGNVDSTPASYTWTIDTVAPDTTIDTNPPNPSNSNDPSFTFSSDDLSATFECQLDSGGWSACTSPQSYTDLSDGSHTFEARATDAAGNVDSTPASYTWTIDTAAPDTTITSNPPNPSNSSSASFGFTGDALGGTAVANFECQLDSGGWVLCDSLTNYFGLGDGSHTFEVRAIDVAGNTDPTPDSYTWLIEGAAPGDDIYVTTTAAGNVDGVPFGKDDILLNSGGTWSLFFNGAGAGLPSQTDLSAIHVNAADDLYVNFVQNSLNVSGLGAVKGADILHYNGSGFAWWFDGSDVGLTTTGEKIDALHILPGDAAPGPGCLAYVLISTQGAGKVPGGSGTLNFKGEDVLGFCATSLGSLTAGTWSMVVDGSDQGMPANSTYGLSVSADGATLYIITKGTFNVDSAIGGHSMVYAYDIGTETFSGPVFSAPDAGLNKKVDGLDYRANSVD